MHWAFGVMAIVIIGFAIAEKLSPPIGRGGNRPDNIRMDLLSTVLTAAVIGPGVLLLSGSLFGQLFPGQEGRLAALPAWMLFALLFVGDDLPHYLWHRASHSVPWLYTLHRAHHSGNYMSIRMIYRNNVFYYAMMPNLWITGALIHLGLGPAYAPYIILKLAVTAGAHSSVRWDTALYRNPRLRWLAWILERVFTTPSAHNMHHGEHAADGVTHYKGNYGNTLFIWDLLFGTARFTRRYPETFGIENMAPQPWQSELFWPLVPLRQTPHPVDDRPSDPAATKSMSETPPLAAGPPQPRATGREYSPPQPGNPSAPYR